MKIGNGGPAGFETKIEKIEEIISELNAKVKLDKSLAYLSKEDYDRVHKQFQILDENIFNHKEVSIDSNDRLEELVDIMSSIADLDFSRIAPVGDDYNHLDYIAISINMMRDRLETKFNELMRVKNVFNGLSDLHIITDLDGIVIDVNETLQSKFKIHPDDVLDGDIQSFFKSDAIVSNYGLDFERDRVIHGIKQGYVANEGSKVVLKISASVYKNNEGREIGYHYKIKPISKGFYTEKVTDSEDEIMNTLNTLVAQINHNKVKTKEQEDVLKEIRQTYMDSNDLSLIETMILNSVNDILDK